MTKIFTIDEKNRKSLIRTISLVGFGRCFWASDVNKSNNKHSFFLGLYK